MKRILTLSSFLLLFSGLAFSQTENITINVGIDGGLPLGNFGDYSNFGIGGSVKGFYPLTEESEIGVHLGYMGFAAKGSNDMVKSSTAIIPIMADYRHTINNFYIEPQLGLAVLRTKSKVNVDLGDMGGFSGSGSASTTNLGWALGAGVVFDQFDISARYQGAGKSGGSLGFVGIRLGYSFGL